MTKGARENRYRPAIDPIPPGVSIRREGVPHSDIRGGTLLQSIKTKLLFQTRTGRNERRHPARLFLLSPGNHFEPLFEPDIRLLSQTG